MLIFFPPLTLTSHSASYPILASHTKFQFPPFRRFPVPPPLGIQLTSAFHALISFLLLAPGSTLCSGEPHERRSRRSRSHHAPEQSRPSIPLSRSQFW